MSIELEIDWIKELTPSAWHDEGKGIQTLLNFRQNGDNIRVFPKRGYNSSTEGFYVNTTNLLPYDVHRVLKNTSNERLDGLQLEYRETLSTRIHNESKRVVNGQEFNEIHWRNTDKELREDLKGLPIRGGGNTYTRDQEWIRITSSYPDIYVIVDDYVEFLLRDIISNDKSIRVEH